MLLTSTIKTNTRILQAGCIQQGTESDVFNWIKKRYLLGSVRKSLRDKSLYSNIVVMYDIETSTVYEGELVKNVIYSHQFAFYDVLMDELICVIVRSVQESMRIFDFLKELATSIKFLYYIHNLPYEFNNMVDFVFNDIKLKESIFLGNNKPLVINNSYGEFRCSYKLTNRSLKSWAENNGYSKLDLDYEKFRDEDSDLNIDEILYNLNDVYIMCGSLKNEIIKYNNFRIKAECELGIKKKRIARHPVDLPLTSTGYVRELVKDCYTNLNSKYLFTLWDYDKAIYDCMFKSFRGGFVQANKKYINVILQNLKHRDFRSAYPATLTEELYPITPWSVVDNASTDLICKPCHMTRVAIKNLELKKGKQPYISFTNNVYVEGYKSLWNGKLEYCEYLEMCAIDPDFRIIFERYNYEEIEILECYESTPDYLDKGLMLVVAYLYNSKCVTDKESEDYMLIKALLNSIYGMTAQSPLFSSWTIDSENNVIKNGTEVKNTALPYQWALYTTAYPREHINEFIDALGDDFVYSDTDSIFYKSNKDFEKTVEIYNLQRELLIREVSKLRKIDYSYIAPNNKVLGTFEVEHENIDKFITMGSKRYVMAVEGVVDATIAGLSNCKHYKNDAGGMMMGKSLQYICEELGVDIFECIKKLGEESTKISIPPEISGKKIAKIVRGTHNIGDYITYSSMVITPIPTDFGYEKNIQNLLDNL